MLFNTPFLAVSLLSILAVAQKCTGQSCSIAALSGSTNESYDDIAKASSSAASSGTAKTPTGSSAAGKQCITKYYKELHLKAPTSIPKASADTGAAKTLAVSRIKRVQGAACKPNINLFARGTTEPGTMGSTVGPSLSKALGSSKWLSKGVSYTADIAGDNCIGFPGGLKCVAQLAALAQECPDSKFFLSGYSQGAMVARICTAFSKDDVKAKIKGVVVFGDPFNGASIKGFPQEGIKTFCAPTDGVCQGKFVIGLAHLSYTLGSNVRDAAKWMNEKVG